MTRRQYFVALLAMMVSGLIGGGLVTWLLPGRAAWAQADDVPKVIRAEKFLLVDETGWAKAVLTVLEGRPHLALFDDALHARATLALSADDEPTLWLSNGPGDIRAVLSVFNDEAGLKLLDAAGHGRVILGATETEHAITGAPMRYPISTISLFDETGQLTWQAP